MTMNNDQNPPQAPRGTSKATGFFRRPAAWVFGAAMALGLAVGAGGLALAAGMEHAGWDRGIKMMFVQRGVARALDSVGATSEQEAKIHDIIATRFTELAPAPGEREALRKQAFELLGAPTIDHAAVEKFRADMIARIDAKSKSVVDGLLQIADQLKPEQRAELTTRLESMRPGEGMGFGGRHPDHGWRSDDDDGKVDKD